ncbi:butyrate kinase [Sedimentibacter acidaminivorans]|uniref:Probable butyrate kinase n=1 Tax=Sedimentibacter acidaminivorans TaxID=913099 RepID=A0ABS4GCZ5_9FIRM|nr:butyrate kinase [Sedimentibacter acidaminivorans]MBP1925559.1 butyrate kinase [Sedimentibacter acidaminivorans]
MTKRQLIINPGSTSTKIAVYEDENQIFEKTIRHSTDEISKYKKISEQFEYRKSLILEELKINKIELNSLSSVVGRGGLLKPIEGGTYKVNDEMVSDLRAGVTGEHASNLGGLISRSIADEVNVPAFIVDPVVVDEMQEVSRISGHPDFERISIWHALNQKAVARRAAVEKFGKKYEDMNFVVAHLGGGISVGAHRKGKAIDVNNALNGEGPFSPERSGSLPVGQIIKACFNKEFTQEEINKMVVGKGGLTAYLGTNSAQEVSKLADGGNKKAELIYTAMSYQVAKAIGEYAVVLDGDVDAIIITGGIAYDKKFVDMISKKVSFIAEVIAYPGEDELLALAQGGLRVLNGVEDAKVY